jgi:hypothetical protein
MGRVRLRPNRGFPLVLARQRHPPVHRLICIWAFLKARASSQSLCQLMPVALKRSPNILTSTHQAIFPFQPGTESAVSQWMQDIFV